MDIVIGALIVLGALLLIGLVVINTLVEWGNHGVPPIDQSSNKEQ